MAEWTQWGTFGILVPTASQDAAGTLAAGGQE